jgi:hypothetical protein
MQMELEVTILRGESFKIIASLCSQSIYMDEERAKENRKLYTASLPLSLARLAMLYRISFGHKVTMQ